MIYYLLTEGFILSVLVWNNSTHDQIPKFDMLYHIAGLVLSVMWIYVPAKILTDFLNVIAVFSRLDKILIGFTLLAWGNSLGDYVAD